MSSLARLAWVTVLGVAAGGPALAQEDLYQSIDSALTWSTAQDVIRTRISGDLDLEAYSYQQPAPGLIESQHDTLVNPRLDLFLDSQVGASLYAFAQVRVDRGFDPAEAKARARVDEYALRYTPWASGILNVQVGKFATVVGTWVRRHHAWDNPFVTAPLPYENPTAIFYSSAARSVPTLLRWAGFGVQSAASKRENETERAPIIWGPSYASGAVLSGVIGRFDYAAEVKNAALSSPPEDWDPADRQWQDPTVSARLGYRPSESWELGVSGSVGSYLSASAASSVFPGYSLGDYREELVAQDVSFAWHHFEFWAEAFETRFTIPRVANATTLAYYLEAKYKVTPQFFGAVRWNQQVFGEIPDGLGGRVRWGRNLERIDLALTYRLTAQAEVKLQDSLLYGTGSAGNDSDLCAVQLVVRF